MLTVKEISKVYRTKKGVPVTALDHVNMTFPEKGMVFLLGKSGSGKTTLLHILAGMDQCDEGEIILNGTSLKSFQQKDYDAYRNAYIGYIFQEYNLLENYTVGENIALAIQLQGREPKPGEVSAILAQVELSGVEGRKPNELSGGQRQRAAIARALVKDPKILMADEPTGALDNATGLQILETLKKLSKEKLVIVVSHDREFAEQYADRIVELADGRVIRDDLPKEGKETEQDSKPNTVGRFQALHTGLPLKVAFRLGAGGLRYKKIRLCLVLLLSAVSFAIFGLTDALSRFDYQTACVDSLYDSKVKTVGIEWKKYREDQEEYRSYYWGEKQMKAFEESTGMHLTGIYLESWDMGIEFNRNEWTLGHTSDIHRRYLNGFAEVDEAELNRFGYRLIAGRLPDGEKNEIAISSYLLESFKIAGYAEAEAWTEEKQEEGSDGDTDEEVIYSTIAGPDDLIGKPLFLNGINYLVTGIVDTGFDMEHYLPLNNREVDSAMERARLSFLRDELIAYMQSSLTNVIMTGKGFINRKIQEHCPSYRNTTGGGLTIYADNDRNYYGAGVSRLNTLDGIDTKKVIWMKEPKTVLGEKELILVFRENHSILSYIYSDPSSREKKTKYKPDGSIDYVRSLQNETLNIRATKGRFVSESVSEEKIILQEEGFTVAGVLLLPALYSPTGGWVATDPDLDFVCSDSLFQKISDKEDGIYSMAIGILPENRNQLSELVRKCYGEKGGDQFPLQSNVTYQLDNLMVPMKSAIPIFLIVALVIAGFSILLFSSFLTAGIAHRKREIGILRAIGAGSRDVFAIFFSEGLLIAFLNFLFASVLAFAGIYASNTWTRNAGLYVTILHFSTRQLLLILFISILTALLSCALPVYRTASKRPVDAIRDR